MKRTAAIGWIGIALLLMATEPRWLPVLEAARLRHAVQVDNARNLKLWEMETVSTACAIKTQIRSTIELASGFGYCWFPTIHQFQSGELLATARTSPDDRNPEGASSAYTISNDRGHTWTRLYPAGEAANVDAAYTQASDHEIYVLGSGYDAVEPFPPGQTKQFHVTLSRFSRSGIELSQTRNAVLELALPAGTESAEWTGLLREDLRPLGRDLPLVNPWGAILDGKNGDWLTTVYYKTQPDPRSTRLVLARSSDQGMTWKEIAVIAGVPQDSAPCPWMGDEGPNEAGMARLADGSLFVVFRTGGYLGYTRSLDNGLSWKQPRPMPFKGVAPRLRLLSNGILALSFGRPGPVVMTFSPDGTGSRWSKPLEIFRGMSTRYTDFVEMSRGKLLIVYDSLPYGWNAIPSADKTTKNTVYGSFVEVTGGNSVALASPEQKN